MKIKKLRKVCALLTVFCILLLLTACRKNPSELSSDYGSGNISDVISAENSQPVSKPESSAPVSTPENKPESSVPVSTPESKPESSVPVSTPESNPESSVEPQISRDTQELTLEEEIEIKKAIIAAEYPRGKIEDIKIEKYIGKFGENEAVKIYVSGIYSIYSIYDVNLGRYAFTFKIAEMCFIRHDKNSYATLEKAYEKGWFTDTEIEALQTALYGKVLKAETNEISLADERLIKREFIKQYVYKDAQMDYSDLRISELSNELSFKEVHDFTRHKSLRKYVVKIDGLVSYEDMLHSEEVAGYTFNYPTSQTYLVFEINNSPISFAEHYTLTEAFEQGELTADEIKALYEKVNN